MKNISASLTKEQIRKSVELARAGKSPIKEVPGVEAGRIAGANLRYRGGERAAGTALRDDTGLEVRLR